MNNNSLSQVNAFEGVDSTVAYLQMIQSAIDRMSTSSAIFKGFAATVGVGSLAAFRGNGCFVISVLILLFVFLILDAYYLQIERRYRYLYECVRDKRHPVDFDMKPPEVKAIIKCDKSVEARRTHFISCLVSKPILLFYIPTLVTFVVTSMIL